MSDTLEVHTTEEVAEMFKVTIATVRLWINEGKLRSVKLGRMHRITAEAIRDFVANQEAR